MPSVAIIGAGPAGLVTARWLKCEGSTPSFLSRATASAYLQRYAEQFDLVPRLHV
jgi:flavin-dependent dehydrogenase